MENLAKHFAIWGSTGEGMTIGGGHCKAAYVDNSIMMISAGAIERDHMPPGFVRFLTEEECEAEGIAAWRVSDEAAKVLLSNANPDYKLPLRD